MQTPVRAEQATPRADRALQIIVVSSILALCVVQIVTYARAERFGADSSVYIQLAQNLVTDGRYEFNHRPHTLYPPGLPATLALYSAVGVSGDYASYVRLMPVFAAVGFLAWFFVLARQVGTTIAAVATLVTATSPALYVLVTRSVISDTLFLAVTGLLALSLAKLDAAKHRRASRGLLAAVLLLVPAAVLVRSAGLSVVAGLFAWAAFETLRHRSPRIERVRAIAATSAALGLASFLAWSAWSKRNAAPEYPGQHMASYVSQLLTKDPHRPELGRVTPTDVAMRLPTNAVIHAAHLGTLIFGGTWVAPLWYSPVVIGIVLLLSIGLYGAIGAWPHAFLAWYLTAYFGIHALWPFDEGQRFMIPVAPLAFAVMAQGAIIVWRWSTADPARAIRTGSIAAAATGALAAGSGDLIGIQATASVLLLGAMAVIGATFLWLNRRTHSWSWAWNAFQIAGRGWGLLLIPPLLLGLRQIRVTMRENMSPTYVNYRHAASVEAAEWLRKARGGPVMAGQFAMLHRLTSRTVVPFPVTSDPVLIADVLRERNVQLLVVSNRQEFEYFEPDEETRLARLQSAFPALLSEAHSGEGFRIFRVER